MKAIVLAAGKGQRLGDITNDIPKPMLKVGGEVILEHNLNWLRMYGIKDVYINLHYLPDVITGYFGDGQKLQIDITYSMEEEILGTAGAVRRIAANWDESFLVIYGDNFYPFEYDLTKFVGFHNKRSGIATIGLYNDKSQIHKSGVAILDENNVICKFVEKPRNSGCEVSGEMQKTDLLAKGFINASIYALEPEIIRSLPENFCDFGKDVFPKLVSDKKEIYGYVFGDQLIAIDTVELYNRVTK